MLGRWMSSGSVSDSGRSAIAEAGPRNSCRHEPESRVPLSGGSSAATSIASLCTRSSAWRWPLMHGSTSASCGKARVSIGCSMSGTLASSTACSKSCDQLIGRSRPRCRFNIRGERGSIDILAFHRATGSLLVIEVKSVVPDLQAMLSGLDRKSRLAPEIARERGWPVKTVTRLLVLPDDRTARRRIDAYATTFETALPARTAGDPTVAQAAPGNPTWRASVRDRAATALVSALLESARGGIGLELRNRPSRGPISGTCAPNETFAGNALTNARLACVCQKPDGPAASRTRNRNGPRSPAGRH